MELTYSNHTVRIVQNPEDIIIRFTDPHTNRNYETTFTERSFIEYQVLGGLEFVSSLLIKALQDPASKSPTITQFKAKAKEITFRISYAPDAHCKMIDIEFIIPAVKKDSANADVEVLTRQVQTLLKLTDALKSTIVEVKANFSKVVDENRAAFNKALEDKTALLKAELMQQKAKSAGFIVIPGIRFVIDENTPELNLFWTQQGCGNLGNTVQYPYNGECSFGFQTSLGGPSAWEGDISKLKYLKKCKRLTILHAWDIKNFTPISEMTELEHLNIITEPSWVYNIINYPNAYLGNKFFDISFVKTLKKLTTVSFFGYKSLKDISPLASCPALTTVDIRHTEVGNTNCLSSTVKINK